MTGPLRILRVAATNTRHRFAAVSGQSERVLLLGSILLLSAISAATAYFLAQALGVDVPSSQLAVPEDCWLDWGMRIGRHCFSDYTLTVSAGLQPNPWTFPIFLPWENAQPLLIGYPAGGILPSVLFGLPAQWLGVPQLGLIGYLVALTIAVLSPALWAARGTNGLERVVVFVALGAAAIPAWAVIDRGNSAGFLVPAALVYLVALRRERWALVGIMVVLAALIKPWFAVLVVALFAARQWRVGLLTLVGVVVSNIAAYLLWPHDFPRTITQSIDNLSSISTSFQDLIAMRNVSFGRAILLLPDIFQFASTGGTLPDGFLAGPRSLIGYVVLLVVVVVLLVLRKRIPPVMAGIVLLATATLFPPLAYYYYLVFALPIAALVVRDPNGSPGSGIFDHFAAQGDRRRAVGICLSLALALSIVQIAIPGPVAQAPILGQAGAQGVVGSTPVVGTTVFFTPFLWLAACVFIIVSYGRRAAPSYDDGSDAIDERTQEAAAEHGQGAPPELPVGRELHRRT